MSNLTHPPFHGAKLILFTIAVSLGIFMNVLDTSIANVAIPTIAGDLAVSPSVGTWVITSFSVSLAIVIPLTGWLAKRFGEVRLFVAATFLFTVASLLCALSINLEMMIIFRVLQGAVAGPMIPLSQSLLLANFPQDKKPLANALWSMTAVVAPICGPVLGGWITDQLSWPWIFYINIPVGLFSVYVSWYLLRDRETEKVKLPIDRIGLGLLIIGVGSLQILLDKGKDLDWFNSNTIVTLAIIATVAISFFIVWEITEKNPVVDLSLFKKRNFFVGTAAMSLGYMIFFGGVVIFPLWLQTQLGYTATWAGIATAPIGIVPFILSPFIAKFLLTKYDLRILISFGFIAFALTSFWFATFNTNISYSYLIIPRLAQGFGLAFFFLPIITLVLSSVNSSMIASASGVSNFLRILGGSFGTSISVTLWEHRESIHHSQLVTHITNANLTSNQLIQQFQHIGLSKLAAYQVIANLVTNQSYMLATDDFFWISAWGFLCLFGFTWFARRPVVQAAPTDAAH